MKVAEARGGHRTEKKYGEVKKIKKIKDCKTKLQEIWGKVLLGGIGLFFRIYNYFILLNSNTPALN